MKKLKAAVYTRKSTTHGLEQEFNSLKAQREAGEAYIASQVSEGWVLVDKAYDDGGISGGTMERPALKELLRDIKNGLVDIIVVYKVDRLTRKLSDFAQIIELLDTMGASFVSVTQQFNTSNSMGRLTLNVLLSFAQFEREVTSERIRDKIAASKKKGIWMGGTVPIGYDKIDKKLVINEEEAKTVRAIFETYLSERSILSLTDAINAKGYRSKASNQNGRGDKKFMKGPITYILTNPLYIGRMKHKGECYEGQHDPIIDMVTWHKVQAKLEEARHDHATGKNIGYPSLLTSVIYHSDGSRLNPTHSKKRDIRHRYYLAHKDNPDRPTQYYNADKVDKDIRNALITWLRDDTKHSPQTLPSKRQLIVEGLKSTTPHQQRATLLTLVDRITIDEEKATIDVKLNALSLEEFIEDEDNIISLKTTVHFRRHKVHKKTVIPSGIQQIQKPDETLIQMIAKAHLWADGLQSGKYKTMTELGEAHGVDKADIGKNVRLAYLAPDIISAIMDGRQPPSLNANKLRRMSDIPSNWEKQRHHLGFK